MSEDVLTRIKSKVKGLMDSNTQLSIQKENLENEIVQLTSVIEQQKTELESFDEKVKMLKMAKSLEGDSESNKEMKLKINELVREIDKCIALLNK